MESFDKALVRERRSKENTGTTDSKNPEKRKWRKLGVYAAIGAVAFGLAGVNAYNRITESGKGKTINALVQKNIEPQQVLDICSWNMQNNAVGEIARLTELGEECDLLALQEVSKRDMSTLVANFPEKNMATIVADALKQQPLQGGFGNVIMTDHELRDVERVSIPGVPIEEGLSAAAGKVLPNITVAEAWADAGHELQEDRGAVAVTIKVDDEGKEKDLKFITGHIVNTEKDGKPDEEKRLLHVSQLKQLIEFIAENTDDGRPTVFCGDLNATREELEQVFADIGFVLAENISTNKRTSVNDDVEIDLCAYYGAGVIGRGVVVVLREYATDHYAIKISFDGDQSNNPVIYFDSNFHEKH